MFCIATFIVFAILAVFSASYRPLAWKAWHCVLRRITLRPCDINFGEEVKAKLIGKLVFTHPRVARIVRRHGDLLATLFVALSIWSLLYTVDAGLMYIVYGTCRPSSVESCSLSGEACGVDQSSLTFLQAWEGDALPSWFIGPVVRFGEAFMRLPDRLRTWHAEDYLSPTATFSRPWQETKPVALEVIDPSCRYCRALTQRIAQANLDQRFNISYLLYPIPLPQSTNTKFVHSSRLAAYIEASKHLKETTPTGETLDWYLLHQLFAEPIAPDFVDWQERINTAMTEQEVIAYLHQLLERAGLSRDDIARVDRLARSAEVQDSIEQQKEIVEQKIRTIKIPTFIINGRRYDRALTVEELRNK